MSLTREISFIVTDSTASLPFDSRYNTRVSLSNRNTEQMADNNFILSKRTRYCKLQIINSNCNVLIIIIGTHAIQNVSVFNHHLLIRFALNTSALGAFLVCNISGAFELSYIFANKSKSDTTRIETISGNSNCSLVMYDIKHTGLLSEKEDIRPAYVLYHQPCIEGCGAGMIMNF